MVNRRYCLIINTRPWYRWGYKSLGLRISRPAPKLTRKTVTGELIFLLSFAIPDRSGIYVVTMLWLLKQAKLSAIFSQKNTEIVLHNRVRLLNTDTWVLETLLHRHHAIFRYSIQIFTYCPIHECTLILSQDWKVCKWRYTLYRLK